MFNSGENLNFSNHNITRVLYTLWKNPGISRVDIAKQLKLNKATITNIVSELIDKNIISILSEGVSSPLGGRKPIYLTVNESYGYIAGIEIQQNQCIGVIINLNGEILYSYKRKKSTRREQLLLSIEEIYLHLKKIAHEMSLQLLGVGIGLSGIIDPFHGIINQSYPLQVKQPVLLSQELERIIDLPFLIENDANCCCWGELLNHKEDSLDDFLFVLSEIHIDENNNFDRVSIGLGIVINNYVHRGNDFSAGEFRSIFREEENDNQFSIPDYKIKNILVDEDVYLQVIKEIAKNIALIVNVLNTKYIFLGTIFEKFQKESQDLFKKYMQANWTYPDQVNCEIKFSSLGDYAVAYGAAAFFLNRMFKISDIDSIHKIEKNISIFDY